MQNPNDYSAHSRPYCYRAYPPENVVNTSIGRFRRPASHDTDTSMYGIDENPASAAHGYANAGIAWMQ